MKERERIVETLEPLITRIIQQQSEHRYTFTFQPRGTVLTIEHDGLWRGVFRDAQGTIEIEVRTPFFRELFELATEIPLDNSSLQELLKSAKAQEKLFHIK